MKNTWTLLVYANGNNELEPEMSKAFYDLVDNSYGCNFNIAIEIGRISREVARIMRPDERFYDEPLSWIGVRRYVIKNKNAEFIQDLSGVNMADPKEVYNFIRWGMEKFKSEHYMLIMGGHGSSFIGMMTDFSKEKPFGLPSMEACTAINKIALDIGKYIEILLLDICYMNVIEVMFEFGKETRSTVKNIITYTGDGPINGVFYDELLHILKNNIMQKNTENIVKAIINNLKLSLAGFRIEHGKLLKIKKAANDAAYEYLEYCKKYDLCEDPKKIQDFNQKNEMWALNMSNLNKDMKSIIIDYNKEFYNGRKIIEITCSKLGELSASYLRMSFAKNNYWSYVVSDIPVDKDILNSYVFTNLEPKALSFNSLYRLILVSMGFNYKKAKEVFLRLVKYKKWTL